ncbi:hypothetical protein QTP88_021123 [Uroleucon formosanum]
MVDCERLISLVFEREPIWDSTSKKHHNRDITRKLWQEIEKEMQVKAPTVSKMSCKLTNEQLLDMMNGMNSDLEFSDEEDDENIDDIAIANLVVESVYGTVDDEDDNEDDDVDIFTPDQLLPIQTLPTDEVSMPNIVTHLNTNGQHSINWLCKPMKQKNIIMRSIEQTEFPNTSGRNNTLPLPISYFMKYFTEEAFVEMAIFTNIYAEQKSTNQWVQITSAKMKVFVGIHLMMGVLNLPRVRIMTRNRFFELRTHFHVINNEEISQTNTDKFIKVRPLYNYMKNRFYQLPIEQNLSIDEQMVPFKGKLASKPYMRGKPHPWGIKIFLMCGSSGIVYDYIMFQGSSTELDPLVQNLFADRHIYAAGIVRVNRFAKPPLITDKCLSKIGRGTSYKVSGISEGVVLGSNFITSGEPETIKRWDKKHKQFVDVERPEVIGLYNKSMGGVDVHDQL